jgi:hypothetical protein
MFDDRMRDAWGLRPIVEAERAEGTALLPLQTGAALLAEPWDAKPDSADAWWGPLSDGRRASDDDDEFEDDFDDDEEYDDDDLDEDFDEDFDEDEEDDDYDDDFDGFDDDD